MEENINEPRASDENLVLLKVVLAYREHGFSTEDAMRLAFIEAQLWSELDRSLTWPPPQMSR